MKTTTKGLKCEKMGLANYNPCDMGWKTGVAKAASF